jgi:cation-transporting P-type ATPase 13A2
MAESLPTSVSAFSHRRARANSMTSFSFYQEEDEVSPIAENEGASTEDLDEVPFVDDSELEEVSTDLEQQTSNSVIPLRRRSSTQSRGSVHSRLLRRGSGHSAGSGWETDRTSQTLYMATEDLYIAIAGFSTSPVGMFVYILLCVLSLGTGWLLLRWLPRLHMKLVGRPAPLRNCQWVVLEVGRLHKALCSG